jgi:hypothetical protein
MFASTNLVIELGILILIFLGWQFLAAEIVGGLVMIVVSSILIRLSYPRNWISAARKKAKEGAGSEEEDFDWKHRIRSREGWNLVGHRFVSDWKMVWEEIVIGFTIAGFVAVLVPHSLWENIFLINLQQDIPGWVLVVENVAVAPFVAAATFIGSMGNIPLATVLNTNGVLFAGIMGFIYSDLIVPPLVMINAKYYGWKVALYIAAVMYASIVVTALILHYLFSLFGMMPESEHRVEAVARFAFDYTLYLNLFFVAVAAGLFRLHLCHVRKKNSGGKNNMGHGIGPKRILALLFFALQVLGLAAFLFS